MPRPHIPPFCGGISFFRDVPRTVHNLMLCD